MTTKTYSSTKVAMGIACSVFLMAGFFTCLNGVIIPRLKTLFELSFAKAMFVQFAFFGAFFLLSLPAERVLAKLGYKMTMILGLILTGAGSLGFWPAVQIRLYPAFLATLFVLAVGVTLLQLAANPFVSLLGKKETASSRLTLAQAFNSLGTTIAPLIGGYFILSGAHTTLTPEQLHQLPAQAQHAYHAQLAGAMQGPYIVFALVSFLLAAFIFKMRFPASEDNTVGASSPNTQYRVSDVMRYSHAVFGIFAIFAYVGAEVALGSLMVNYFTLPQIGNLSESQSTWYISIYWGLAMVGRFIGSALLAHFKPRYLVGIFASINVVLLASSVMLSGMPAVYALICIGLFNSIMFPTIFTLGIAQLGHLTGVTSSLLLMGTIGGAIIPFIQGRIADSWGLQISFLLPAISYIYITFYGFWGAKVRQAPEIAKQKNT